MTGIVFDSHGKLYVVKLSRGTYLQNGWRWYKSEYFC
jgi:hypothetical protein